MQTLAQGAEAIITTDGTTVTKTRLKKEYRQEELDQRLRKLRTRHEARIMEKLRDIIPVPKIELADETDMILKMEHVQGEKLRDVLEKDPKKYGAEIGTHLAKMHDLDIVHGDLTTSNIIASDTLVFIDFGLAEQSEKVEDKAVDLHLIRQALESKHHTVWQECYESILTAYKEESKSVLAVLKRLEKVEARGRNKH